MSPAPQRRPAAFRPLNLAGRRLLRPARERIREGLWPIVQTTVAAVGAYALALVLLPQEAPVFAPVAAIVALGASFGQRGRRAVELVLGIVLGIAIGELIITLTGTGLVQIGALVFLAMVAAVAVGGGPVLVSQAGVSALFLAVLEPVDPGSSPDRVLESLVGGAVALAVNALLFPPNPVRKVERATRAALEDLAGVLELTAEALESGAEDDAGRALRAARTVDEQVDALDDAIEVGWETSRYTTLRRTARAPLESYEEEGKQIDLAVRNARVLARNVLRFVRRHGEGPPGLADAIRQLAVAVSALSQAPDDPSGRQGLEARRIAADAARMAGIVLAEHGDLATSAIISQIRSTAVDIVRASEIETPAPDHSFEAPTEELLAPRRPRDGGAGPPPRE